MNLMSHLKREERLFHYLTIATLLFFLMHTCNGPKPRVIEKRTTDIEYLPGKRDTIYIPQKARVIYVKVGSPLTEEIDPNDSSMVREYSSRYEDSLISGNINVKVDGELLAQSLVYTPKFPKYIKQVDTLKITETITRTLEKEPRAALVIGGTFSGNQVGIGITPMAGFMDKRQMSYLAGYDLVNKTYSLTITKPLRIRK